MEVVIESSQARSLHTVPFLIRFAPELICRLREIFSPDRSVSGEITGVLFGVAESDFAVVQALRLLSSLPSGNEEVGGTKTPLQASLNTILRGALFNAELSGLELLGWFSARTAIGLRKEDITFHEQNFQSRNDIALIVRNEPAGYLSIASYCRSFEGDFSSQNHRCGTLRISLASLPVTPLEVPMRPKMHDDVYMRAYQLGELGRAGASVSTWKDAFASKTKQVVKRLRCMKAPTKLKRAGQERQPKERSTDNLERVRSMTQALQYATTGGAAPAPARSREGEPSPSCQPVLQRTDEIRYLHSEEPRIVSSHHEPEPIPEQAAPAARSESHVASPGTSNERSGPEPPHSPVGSRVLGLDSALTPTGELDAILPAQVAKLPGTREGKLRWLVSAAVFALATVGTWAFLYWKNAEDQPASPGWAQIDLRSPRLGLRLSKAEERVRITWNRQSPVLRNASEAILQINDGPSHREIRLTGTELTTGSILYLPKTSDAAVRLEAHDPAGQVVSESVRIGSALTFSKASVKRAEAPVPTSGSSVATGAVQKSQVGGNHTMASARSVWPMSNEGAHNGNLNSGNQRFAPADRASIPGSANQSASAEASRPAPRNPSSPSHRVMDSDEKGTGTGDRTGKPAALFRPPRPVQQVLPKLDGSQRDLPDGTVELRVLVGINEAGRVVAARLLQTSNKLSTVVNSAALDAARQWTFVPASMNGKSIESDHTIVFRLMR